MIPSSKLIPFEDIEDHIVANGFVNRLQQMFPNGNVRGKEFIVGNIKGDPGESLSVNILTGEWNDFNDGNPGSGPNFIGLYAAKYHNGDRVAAGRELGCEIGLMDRVGTGTAKVVPIRRDAPPVSTKSKPKKDVWLPEVPAPGDAPEPNLSRWDHAHAYYTEHGELARYVVRNNASGSKPKIVLPQTYGILNGVRGWHTKHAPTPRCPYGLDRAAAMPNTILWIVAGEKKADALQSLFSDRPVMSWTGGDKAVTGTDWTSVRGRSVIIWPDADTSGIDAAEKLVPILLTQENKVWVVDVGGMPEKWDADDAINGADYKWDAAQILEWVKPRLRAKQKTQAGDNQAPQAGTPPKDRPAAPRDGANEFETGNDQHGVVPLGHNHGLYYYYSKGRKQVVSLTAASHKKLELMALASTTYFWERSRFTGEKGVAWDAAAAHLMDACHAVGIFDPARIRGRGAWLDDGRSVLHLGDRLLVDGEERDLFLKGSKFVYEHAVALSQAVAPPLTAEESSAVLDIFKGFAWDREINAELAAGWVAVAPICGALAWRPSIWLTGPSGSGKTTLTSVIASCLGGMALNVQSKTSEAGIRQALNSDARPVLFDEAEGEDKVSKSRLQAVFDLVRQSSSEGGAEIVKGTANQSGAKRYRIRSCFLFSSINVSLDNQADENRITVLALKTPPTRKDDATSRQREEAWKEFNRDFTARLTPQFCAGLIARSVRMAPTIRWSAEIFAAAAAKHFGNRRAGDQLGALLAGAYALRYDDVVTKEYAEDWIEKNAPKLDAADTDIETDEHRLLHFLMQVRVRVGGGNNMNYDRIVGELIAASRPRERQPEGYEFDIPEDKARHELNRNGIRYESERAGDGSEGIWVANRHSSLSRWLADTPWSAQWSRALIRLPGAQKSDKAIKFAHGVVQRAAWIPISVVLPEETQGDG